MRGLGGGNAEADTVAALAAADIFTRCGRVVTDFDWEAKNRFNF